MKDSQSRLNHTVLAKAARTDIKALAKKVDALSNALVKLSSKDDFKELILTLKCPGWTTLPELIFFKAIADP